MFRIPEVRQRMSQINQYEGTIVTMEEMYAQAMNVLSPDSEDEVSQAVASIADRMMLDAMLDEMVMAGCVEELTEIAEEYAAVIPDSYVFAYACVKMHEWDLSLSPRISERMQVLEMMKPSRETVLDDIDKKLCAAVVRALGVEVHAEKPKAEDYGDMIVAIMQAEDIRSLQAIAEKYSGLPGSSQLALACAKRRGWQLIAS